MQNSDEKFFEALAEKRAAEESDYEVEFAKTSGSAVAEKKTAAKKAVKNGADSTLEEGSLMVDVYQTPDDIVVESAIAGVSPDDLDITATTDSITIRGERRKSGEITDDDYLYRECFWGRFSRSVLLPQEVDPEQAEVTFKNNGILTVRLPKLKRQKTKKLKVRFD